MTAEGALSAEAVKVSGGDLEAAKGLKVSKGLLEAKSGMTAEGALSAEAVKVSGGDLEALKGLKVSNGLLEAKAGMIIGGTLTVKEKIAVTVEGGTLNVGNGLNVGLDKFVVNSKGEATFDEKAEFKKGLNVTGILMKGGKIDVGAYYTLYGWYDDPDKTNKFQIAYEGKPAAWLHGNTGAWTQQSSRRFKENIAVISDALSKLDQVRGVYFDWIDGQPSVSSGSPKERQIGMIAEEVQAVFPELVSRNTHNNKEILGLAYSSFTAVLVQAVKELKAMNQSLSDRVKDLEASAMNES
jgi:hypothetical protein